jgi:hypothetical protein
VRQSWGIAGMTVAAAMGMGGGYWLARYAAGQEAVMPARRSSTAVLHNTPVPATVSTVADALRIPDEFAQTEALFALAGRADEATLSVLIDEARALPNRNDRFGALDVLLSRYTQLDPPAALALATEFDAGSQSRIGLTRTVLAAWSRIAFDAAAQAAATLPTPEQRYQAAWALVSSNLDADPDRLRRALAPLVGFHMTDTMLAETGVDDETGDPVRALRRAQAGPRNDEQRARIYQIAVEWARRDPAAALAQSRVLTDDLLRSIYEQAVAKQWAESNPEAFFEHARRSADATLNLLAVNTVLPAVAMNDPFRAMSLAARLPKDEQDYAREQILGSWVSQDTESAAAWVEALPPDQQARLARTVADTYLQKDPQAALAWAGRLTSTEREQILAQLLSRLVLTQPELALRALPALHSPEERLTVVSRYLAERPDAALATAVLSEFPDGEARRAAVSQLAQGMAAEAPEQTLRWLRSVEPDRSEGTNFTVVQALYQWASRDPRAAMAYADQMAPNARAAVIPALAAQIAAVNPASASSLIGRYAAEAFGAELIDRVGESLASRDPQSALALATGRDDPLVRQRVTGMAAKYLTMTDPRAALDLWARIDDPEIRRQTAQGIAGAWANVDLESAARWALTLRPEPARQAALAALLERTVHSPELSLQLISQINSDDERFHAAIKSAATMAQFDPATARDFARRVALDDSRRQRLEQGVARIAQGLSPCEW